MINLKIKTLDSQDHDFSVDEEITVRQFKEHISANTGVAADNQRLIYCGRVLQDAKLLREYDVNGKVVHLVEGAPPRSRSAADANRSSDGNTAANRRRDQLNDHAGRPPIFRTIDGMVLGAMAIPMNNGDGTTQTVSNLSNSFSTLCMNRITVARHMLECVNNIVNYLENPEVGLNNNDMDVQRTMESTIFEVGISTLSEVEVPQQVMQNFVQVFQGAVSAAFRQNGLTSVEVGGQASSANATADGNSSSSSSNNASTNANASGNNSDNNAAAAAQFINMIMDPNVPTTNAQANVSQASGGNTTTPPTTTANADSQSQNSTNNGTPTRSRNQTTSTLVLAEVVQQMRNTQGRLEPFLQQYYDILQNEPTFAENETTARENAQRVFDRVSEALHYFSHAQHAVSDLMLDLTLPTPRHLCCRPILVEQSAFVSSGFTLPTALRRDPASNNNETAAANNNTVNAEQQQPRQHINIIQPTAPLATADEPQEHHILDSVGFLGFPQDYGVNQANGSNDRQMEMAQLIRAVVNSVPMHTDVRVEISRRNDVSPPPSSSTTTTQVPTISVNATQAAANETSSSTATTATSADGSTTSTTTGGGGAQPQPRVTTATHPTTATQTRSTARPQSQIQLTGLPVGPLRTLRPVTGTVQTSFDRFLPCSSHHVRENRERQNTMVGGQPIGVTVTNAQPITVRRNRRPAAASSTPGFPNVPPSASNTRGGATAATSSAFGVELSVDDPLSVLTIDEYSTPVRIFGSQLAIRDLVHIAPNPAALNRIRSDLHTFVVQNFGSPLNQNNLINILEKINGILNVSTINANAAENPSFDALNSVYNLIRNTLPTIVNLILEDDSVDFGMRLLRALIEFVRRLLTLLGLCVGRQVGLNFIREMTDICLPEPEASERTAIAAFKRHIIAAARRQFVIMQNMDTSDVNEFLVIRLPQSQSSDTQQQQQEQQRSESVANMSITDDEPMDTDPIPENTTDSLVNLINRLVPTLPPLVQPTNPIVQEPLPQVVVGSASWHAALPTQWLPVITQDIGRQRRAPNQGPYSDGYLSGMSSKRRKLIANKKPNVSNPNQFITDTFRHVVRSHGIQQSQTTSAVEDALTSNVQLHEPYGSFEQRIRQHIEARLSSDSDFNPARFPNCSKWLDKK